MSDFTGRWFTTFGRMEQVQSGEHVKGTRCVPALIGT